jgi:hypothetical protein
MESCGGSLAPHVRAAERTHMFADSRTDLDPLVNSKRWLEVAVTLRLRYVAGADGWAQAELHRPLKTRELEGVIIRFPGAGAGDPS